MSGAYEAFVGELDRLLSEAVGRFESAPDAEAVKHAKAEFLGLKNGRLKDVQQGLGKVDKADKPAAGKRFNEVKQALEAALQAATERTEKAALDATALAFDRTLPGQRQRLGRLHPLTQTIAELQEIMGRLGFEVAEGPEIEDDYHNFEALNIPAAHPARHPADNFYLSGTAGDRPLLLRSQTSTVQIRVMESRQPPVRIISLGRVYRPDPPDATHYPMFHQIEGLYVDKGVTMAHLKSTLRIFCASYLGQDVTIRFRPSFFPFTEPSVEVDMLMGDGRWVEMGGAGMVDPNVLRAVNIDPEVYTGFAFGLGIERVCMRRHGVVDLRQFFESDVRFLRQF
ncbi:MAG TPA: phenylalanine--tRNA ligase subunit alpha [Pirellulales bacterium]